MTGNGAVATCQRRRACPSHGAARRPRILLPVLLAMALATVAGTRGVAASERVDFRQDVEPLLIEHCYECHGPGKREGDLRLTSRKDAFRPTNLGIPVIEPGRSDLSPLIDMVSSRDPKTRMPKDRVPLTPAEIDLLRRWIDEGAEWPDGGTTPHWAYVAPQRPARPEVANPAWPRNEIDYFVLAQLERRGLAPSPPADKATLLRRVHLDLTGIPPTPAELDAFLADGSPDAYERVVDRLLASPRFGEHWARQWLDAARFADSNGFKADSLRKSWVYRDWVIRAINDDLPFDQFTVKQIAGDLLPDAGLDDFVATGFLRASPLSLEAGVDAEEARIDQLRDRVNTISTVWLGSTLECAQCHDHKYDPFSQEEYYRFYAFLNRSPGETEAAGVFVAYGGPQIDVPPTQEIAARRREILRQVEKLRAELAASQPAPDVVDAWIRENAALLRASKGWTPAKVESFATTEPEEHRLLPDGSVLLAGPSPVSTTYDVALSSTLDRVTGIRVVALPDDALPDKGPGRGAKANPSYLLTEVVVRDAQGKVLATATPFSSTHAPGAEAGLATDGDSATGWTARRDADGEQWIVLPLAPDAKLAAGADGRVRLSVALEQDGGMSQTIGRVAFQLTDVDPRILELPPEIQARLVGDEARAIADRPLRLMVASHLGRRDLQPLIRHLVAKADALASPTTQIMIDSAVPRTTHVFLRGDHRSPGAEVTPGTPKVLPPMPADAPADRLGLARWLVARDNPLTMRVTVNRWWSEIFGRGIVETVEDFGTRGARPSNQRLLDWLAVELAESGSRKKILRQIVTSATYRQSSRFASPEALEKDPDNVLLWRMPRLRLPAETIRDQGLAISGLLVERIGGPSVYPPQPDGLWKLAGGINPVYATELDDDRYRRGVYVIWRRVAPYPTFSLFDAPDRASCTVRRSRTNTPLQALALLNDEAYVEMATALAARVLAETPDAPDDARLRYALRLTLAREPSPAEIDVLRRRLNEARTQLAADPAAIEQLARSRAGQLVASAPADARAELAAWSTVATVLLNLDETVTRS